MKDGDLSNDMAPCVGIRFERVIRTDEGRLNRAAKGYLQSLMGAIGVNVYIITTGDPRKAMGFCYKWGIPYHRVIDATSELEIPDIVRENDMLTYYDMDRHILQNVNSRGHGKVEAKLWTSVESS